MTSGPNSSFRTSGSKNVYVTGESIESSSGDNSKDTWPLIGLGIAIGVLLTGAAMALYIYMYYRDRKKKSCRPTDGTTMETSNEREHESMLDKEGTRTASV